VTSRNGEACAAKGLLVSAGIKSFLANSNIVRMYGLPRLFGGAKLLVPSDDFEAARSLLEQTPPEKFEVEGVGEFVQPH